MTESILSLIIELSVKANNQRGQILKGYRFISTRRKKHGKRTQTYFRIS